jgi:hypothetical protein
MNCGFLLVCYNNTSSSPPPPTNPDLLAVILQPVSNSDLVEGDYTQDIFLPIMFRKVTTCTVLNRCKVTNVQSAHWT